MEISFSSPLVSQENNVRKDLMAWLYYVVYPNICQTGSYVIGEDIVKFTSGGYLDSTSHASSKFSTLNVEKILQQKLDVLSEMKGQLQVTTSPTKHNDPAKHNDIEEYFQMNLTKLSVEISLKNGVSNVGSER